MADEDFPDEDFEDLPLDELDSVIYHESTNVFPQSDSSHRNTPDNNTRITGNPNSSDRERETARLEQQILNGSGSWTDSRRTTQKRDYQGYIRGAAGQAATSTSTSCLSAAAEAGFVANNEGDFMDDDMDCFIQELETCGVRSSRPGGPDQLPVHQGPCGNRESSASKIEMSGSNHRHTIQSSRSETDRLTFKSGLESSHSTLVGQGSSSDTRESDSTAPAVTLTSPPFTYLCLLEEHLSQNQLKTTVEMHVKAFIVTLLGKLSSNSGVWRVCATISDGTGYLDVELSDEVLTDLLGFSVAQKGALKRDPARRGELDAGMRRCQEELVDMCCVMTIVVEPEGRKAVVTKAAPVNEKVLQELEQRVRDRRK